MTVVYFVRHAECNYNNHDDPLRELTEKGLKDSKLVTQFLSDKEIDIAFSSPYRRAMDTIRDYAESTGLEIHIEDGFRERKIVKFTFENNVCVEIRPYNLFEL